MEKRSWLSCPDCEGGGCRLCGGSGRWPNPTPKAARATARILRLAGQTARAAKYEAAADLLEPTRPQGPTRLLER